jgi:hypothetical protein
LLLRGCNHGCFTQRYGTGGFSSPLYRQQLCKGSIQLAHGLFQELQLLLLLL